MNKRRFLKLIVSFVAIAIMLMSLAACGKTETETVVVSEADDSLMTVSFIDVGKGDCILVQKGSSVILIDAGYEETADEVISYLKNNGISSIDYLIITHYDKDHMGGAAQVAEEIEIGQIYLPGYEGSSKYYTAFMEVIEANGLNASQVTEDITFTLEDAVYTILASDVEYDAEDGSEGNDNDVSLVITAIYGEDSYLFAGDLEKAGIKAYLASESGEYDVIKMPHHGKYSGKLADFVESLNPKIAVITDSTDDPAEDEVLEMLSQIDVYRSSESGTIVITSSGTGQYQVAS